MTESRRLIEIKNTILRILQECRNTRELKQIHSQIITSPYLSTADHHHLLSRLLFTCTVSNCGDSLTYAQNVFRAIHNPTLFVYNAMIRAYASKISDTNGPTSSSSLILYKQMLSNGITPDRITFPFLIKECTRRPHCWAGRSVQVHAVKLGLDSDLFVQNSLINLYCVSRVLRDAVRVFDEMSKRDIVSWNTLIIGCLRSGEFDLALDLFSKMNDRNNFTWNSIITGFVQGGRPKQAVKFFHEMQVLSEDGYGVAPDKITVASVLSACASLGALDQGKWVHSYLLRSGLECDMVIGTALVDMYGKCGSVERAVEVFTEMPKKDVLAWTAMISVFALHGYGFEAFDLFRRMVARGLRPNPVTFVGLLSSCAHSGLVEEARWCFGAMTRVYSIKPQVQHYACMVDVLCRAGLFDEAESLIGNMPMEPDAYVWGALLGGCQMHGNVGLGEKVARHLINLEPSNHVFYVILSDIYSKAGRFEDRKRVRTFMHQKGIKKAVPGSSMTEIDGIVYKFSVNGSPEVVMEEIKCILLVLSNVMKIGGTVVDLID